MRAALLDSYSRPAHLRLADVPEPEPGRGQVRIAVRAVGINPRDWLLCEGRYVFRHLVPGFPKIPGSDVSGVIDAVGEGVRRSRVGDEVVAMQTLFGRMGAYAERFVVDEAAVGRKPSRMSFEEAAGLPVAALTALQMLRDDGALEAGETVAVVGASGGVGHYAVQLARHLGATVVGVCSAASHDLVLGLGAHRVL
ncbi:MAG: NADP-dependent oxidoreductase, partial [Deltaproteobacteria bacterium]|nr:NADP-dependent oxidoreductase [Deltaproteobacteria bacterium]